MTETASTEEATATAGGRAQMMIRIQLLTDPPKLEFVFTNEEENSA